MASKCDETAEHPQKAFLRATQPSALNYAPFFVKIKLARLLLIQGVGGHGTVRRRWRISRRMFTIAPDILEQKNERDVVKAFRGRAPVRIAEYQMKIPDCRE
jgi:hypothetical protein